jgi:hypothetical protein
MLLNVSKKGLLESRQKAEQTNTVKFEEHVLIM